MQGVTPPKLLRSTEAMSVRLAFNQQPPSRLAFVAPCTVQEILKTWVFGLTGQSLSHVESPRGQTQIAYKLRLKYIGMRSYAHLKLSIDAARAYVSRRCVNVRPCHHAHREHVGLYKSIVSGDSMHSCSEIVRHACDSYVDSAQVSPTSLLKALCFLESRARGGKVSRLLLCAVDLPTNEATHPQRHPLEVLSSLEACHLLSSAHFNC